MSSNQRWTRALVPLMVLAASVPTQQGVAASATSRERRSEASAVYSCQGDDEVTGMDTPVTFALMDEPTKVRAAEAITLRGELTLAFSETTARQSQLALATSASIDATDFSLSVEVEEETYALAPTSVIGQVSPVDTPFRLTVELSYPPLMVPATSKGKLTVRLPEQPAADTDQTVGPPEAPDTKDAAFTVDLRQDSDLDAERTFTCQGSGLGSGSKVLVVPIEVSNPASPGSLTGQPSSTPQPVGGQGAPDALIAPDSPPGSTPDAAPGASAAPVAAPVSAPLSAAPVPPATITGRTFIPNWVLGLFAALLPGSAVTLAAWQRRQLKRLTSPTTPRP